MNAAADYRNTAPFSRGGVAAIITIGFAAFLAMLYFLASGATGEESRSNEAHASAGGLHGYAGLSRLLESNGQDVNLSRDRAGLETSGLLILTPRFNSDPQAIAKILKTRSRTGPTLLILPKWQTAPPPRDLPEEQAETLGEDWIRLVNPSTPQWLAELPEPFAISRGLAVPNDRAPAVWSGMGRSGVLPTPVAATAPSAAKYEPLISDGAGRLLALEIVGEPGSNYRGDAEPLIVVVDPDLVNNYGLADPGRAAAALSIVRSAGYGDMNDVTFDLTLAGLGDATNLLTLAFQPPFLAATICLVLALLIVAWRAFMRFGPTAAPARQIAFGKARLVENGAGLIVRARRLTLLTGPYALAVQRRIAKSLGLKRIDSQRLDDAIAARIPDSDSFSTLAAKLEQADTPAQVLHAAKDLDRLTRTLKR